MRTFVCIEISDAIRRKMSQVSGTLSLSGAEVRWVEPQNIHLTLKFLGEVPEALIAEACKQIKSAVAGVRPFTFSVEGLGTFPPAGNPRVVWCGLKEESGALEKLQHELNAALRDYAQKEDRKKFSPHLTIGRVRGPENADRLRAAIEKNRKTHFGVQEAGELLLMMSELSPQGPTYTPLGRWPLR